MDRAVSWGHTRLSFACVVHCSNDWPISILTGLSQGYVCVCVCMWYYYTCFGSSLYCLVFTSTVNQLNVKVVDVLCTHLLHIIVFNFLCYLLVWVVFQLGWHKLLIHSVYVLISCLLCLPNSSLYYSVQLCASPVPCGPSRQNSAPPRLSCDSPPCLQYAVPHSERSECGPASGSPPGCWASGSYQCEGNTPLWEGSEGSAMVCSSAVLHITITVTLTNSMSCLYLPLNLLTAVAASLLVWWSDTTYIMILNMKVAAKKAIKYIFFFFNWM